jgi:hypothetical protein
MQLSKDVKVSQAITVTNGAAGVTDITGAVLDMADFEGVLMAITFGAIVSGAVTSIKAQQDSASGFGTAADLAGTAQAVADTDDEKTFYIDVYKPEERYVALFVDRATQNATCHATYFQYGPRKKPVTHGANVSGETHISPAEGTA